MLPEFFSLRYVNLLIFLKTGFSGIIISLKMKRGGGGGGGWRGVEGEGEGPLAN